MTDPRDAVVQAAWEAMRQADSRTMPGYVLVPIDAALALQHEISVGLLDDLKRAALPAAPAAETIENALHEIVMASPDCTLIALDLEAASKRIAQALTERTP